MNHDHTTDPALRSWVASANNPEGDFPVQNLPFGIFRRRGTTETPRGGVAIGDSVVDISACLAAGLFDDAPADARQAAQACSQPTLNELMSLGTSPRRALRGALSSLLSEKVSTHKRQTAQHALVKLAEAELFMPAAVGDYTDFYASVHHATNVGSLFRPDNPLLPNYKWIPIGYHGRASSIVVSGTEVKRPSGQRKTPEADAPRMEPSQALDYELEMGAFVSRGNTLGQPIPIGDADDYLFGLCLLNDWSARDIQSWEYQPLGPFLAKNFASSVSPWVVTLEALEPFRAALSPRLPDDPEPLAHLRHERDSSLGGFDITLEVSILSERMRSEGHEPAKLSRATALDLYWSIAQMLTHHSSSGCNMRPGDLLGTGTISGAEKSNRGCLLEITRRGAEPVELPDGETRKFLEDGDEIILAAFAERDGAVRIGFGECRGRIIAAG